MTLTVLLSAYNGEKYIREQIDSILAQEGDFSLSLLVRDDGSTDSTHAILNEYAAAGRLTWYAGDNLGPAGSFLELLRRAEDADYFAFADQDDRWLPGKLAAAIERLDGHAEPALYAANATLVDSTLQPLGRDVYRTPPRTDFYTVVCSGGLLGCTMVMNAALAAHVRQNPAPQKTRLHDYYVLALCTAVGGTVLYDDTPRLLYRQHGGNVVGVTARKRDALKQRVTEITTRSTISIADQAATLLPYAATERERAWLTQVANYRRNIFTRLGLALSRKPRYASRNMAVKLRLAILLGNR